MENDNAQLAAEIASDLNNERENFEARVEELEDEVLSLKDKIKELEYKMKKVKSPFSDVGVIKSTKWNPGDVY